MTYDQYWNQDSDLVKAYREAEKLRRDSVNQQAWLQGLYIYDAICCASPLMQAFTPKGTKAAPYPEEPYPITKEQREQAEMRREKAKMMRIKRSLESFVEQFNANKKGDEANGKSAD